MNHLSQAPPRPTRIATYCLPSTMKVIGGALTPPPVLNFHFFSNVLASSAMTLPVILNGWLGPPPVQNSRALSFSGTDSSRVIRLQLSMTGIYQSFRSGL